MYKWNSCRHFWATTQKCLNKAPKETSESMKIVQDISETIDWSPRVQTVTLRLHYTNIPLWHRLCMNERWTPQTEKLLGAGQWQDPPEDVRHSASHEVRWFGQTRPHQRPAGGHFALAVLSMFLFAPRSTYWSHRWVLVLSRSPGTSSFCFEQWICFGGARL